MTFRIGFNDTSVGWARIMLDGDGRYLVAIQKKSDRHQDDNGALWKTWSLDWVVDVMGRPMPSMELGRLTNKSREAIANVARSRLPDMFLDRDGYGSLDAFFHPIETAPRFRLVYGEKRDKAMVVSISQHQQLDPGLARGTVHRPRFAILDNNGHVTRNGDLLDLVAGHVLEIEQLDDLVGDPFFQEHVAGRFIKRLREIYPEPKKETAYAGRMLPPQVPVEKRQDLKWLDPIIAEQRRIQGPVVMGMIAEAARLDEGMGSFDRDELERDVAANRGKEPAPGLG